MPVFFVAGATGYTGRHLVAAAGARDGISVVAHVRPGSSSADALIPELTASGAVIDRSPWTLDALVPALQTHGVTHAFGLLGTTKKRARQAGRRGEAVPSYQTVDRDLTLLLHQACGQLDPVPRFLFLSSLGAGRPGGNAYLRARFEVEAALQAGDVPWTIIRPSFISGPDRRDDRPLERVGSALADAGLAVVGALGARTIRDRYQTLDGQSLALGVLAAALDPDGVGAVWDPADLRARR